MEVKNCMAVAWLWRVAEGASFCFSKLAIGLKASRR